jgi:iron complex transport system substrate-binding protein
MPLRIRTTAFLVLVCVLFAFAIGCKGETQARPAAGPPQRIVSTSPNTTETLFALGVGARVVGRSRYCDYPPEATALPVVGGFVDASFEAILGLRPDLVVGGRGPAGRALVDKIESSGIPTFFPRTESIAEIDAMVVDLGKRLGLPERSADLVERMRSRRASIAGALEGAAKPRTVLVLGLSPIVVAGPASLHDELLRLAAAQNVIDAGGPYPTVGIEHLLRLDPDVVVDLTAAEAGGGRPPIGPDAPGWRDLPAVRQGRVRSLAGDAAVRPGPRIAEGLAALARAIHPESRIP